MDFYVKSKEVRDGFLDMAGNLVKDHHSPESWKKFFPPGHLPVIVIDIGAFKSAKVALTPEQFKQIAELHPKERKLYTVPVEDLMEVINHRLRFKEHLKHWTPIYPKNLFQP